MADPEAILASLSNPGALVEPLNLKKNQVNNQPEQHVYRILSIPLWGWLEGPVRDRLTPYPPNAKAWKEYIQTHTVNPLIFMLQFIMLLEENVSKMGGFCCKVSKKDDPKFYSEVCMSMAKTLTGRGEKSDVKNRRDYVHMTERVDLEFAHDVEYCKKVLAQKAQRDKRKKEKAAPKKKAAAKTRKRKVETSNYDHVALMYESFGVEFSVFNRKGLGSTITHDEEWRRKDPAPEVAEEAEEAEEEEDDVDVQREPYTGPDEEVEKIKMTITEIPHYQDPNVIMGLMINFVIRDPAINPGAFYCEAVQNLQARAARRQGGRGIVLGKPEMFPEYETHMLSFLPAGNMTTMQTYAHCVEAFYPGFAQQYFGSQGGFISRMNVRHDRREHLYNLLTPEFAIQHLKLAGGCPVTLGKATDWIDRQRGVLSFPEDVQTWKPPHMATFWFNPKYAGFMNHYFPFVNMDSDFLRALCSGVYMADFLSGASDASSQKQSRMEEILTQDMLVLKKDIENQRSLGYETSNDLIFENRECQVIYSHINEYYPELHYADTLKAVQDLFTQHGVRWRHFLDDDLRKRVEECELYNTILKTAQEARMKKFCTIIRLHDSPDMQRISDSIKNMIRWYQKVHESKLPHMTRPYVAIDPQLDAFGNTTLQQLFIFTGYAKILQPMICILSEGLFSCYDAFQEELSYHQMIHGRYDVGKTHTAIKMLRVFSTIPGTITETSLATKASDTTHKHSYDEIVATDECPDWMANEAEAKKNPELVNKEKVKMTRGQLVQKTFVWSELPSGRRLRWNEDVTTDHKKAYVYVTNLPVEPKKALSSRTHRFIMKQPNVSPAEMKGYVGEASKNDAKMWLHINQFLSALSKKLAAVGGILPEVEMDLFDDISTRVIKYLQGKNAIGHDAGQRSLEIMKPYLRQIIYKMAIRYAFDFEWSENFERKFELEHLQAIQPFLYVTVSQIWFVWTACASEWINDDYCNVLRAMLIETRCQWQEGDTPYSIYERDVGDKIKFRTYENRFYDKAAPGDSELPLNKFYIDLNYMVLEGTEDNIAQRVSQHTNPRMEPDQIKGIFKRLSEMQKVPDRGGYAPQLKGTFAVWHKYDKEGHEGKKKIDPSCPLIYMQNNDVQGEPRGEDDVPTLGEGATLSIVDRSDLNKKKLYFMPNVSHYFRQEMILEALRYATLCGSTPEGKILLGFTARDNTTRLEVQPLPRRALDTYLKIRDEEMGFTLRRDRSWKSDDPDAVSRQDGIVFNRCAAFSDVEAMIATAVPFAPKPVGDNSWKSVYEQDAEAMSKPLQIIRDLDLYSATRQHMRCGRPLDEPVRTPQWIKQKTGNKSLGVDYPKDITRKRSTMEKTWKKTVFSRDGQVNKEDEDVLNLKHFEDDGGGDDDNVPSMRPIAVSSSSSTNGRAPKRGRTVEERLE